MLSRSSKSGHPCFVSDLRVKVFSLNNDIIYNDSYRFFANDLYQNEEFLIISRFSEVFKSGVDDGFCQKAFYVYIEMIIWYFKNFIDIVDYID